MVPRNSIITEKNETITTAHVLLGSEWRGGYWAVHCWVDDSWVSTTPGIIVLRCLFARRQRRRPMLTLLEPQSRFGDKAVRFQAVCPQNGTAVLRGLKRYQSRREKTEKNITLVRCNVRWFRLDTMLQCPILLRGTIVNRTYGTHKKLDTSLFVLIIFGPIFYGPP